jgi:hypothetical protein
MASTIHHNLHVLFTNYLFHNKLIGHVFTHLYHIRYVTTNIGKEWVPIFVGGKFLHLGKIKIKKKEKEKKLLFSGIFGTFFKMKTFKLATSRPTHCRGHHL